MVGEVGQVGIRDVQVEVEVVTVDEPDILCRVSRSLGEVGEIEREPVEVHLHYAQLGMTFRLSGAARHCKHRQVGSLIEGLDLTKKHKLDIEHT